MLRRNASANPLAGPDGGSSLITAVAIDVDDFTVEAIDDRHYGWLKASFSEPPRATPARRKTREMETELMPRVDANQMSKPGKQGQSYDN
jgi:hypothetical protein